MNPATLERYFHPFGDFAAIVLGIGALVFAVVQFKHSRHLIAETKKIEKSSEQLTERADSLTVHSQQLATNSAELATSVNAVTTYTKRIATDTEAIASSVPTRFVGEFPKNMRAIHEVIANAVSGIEIMVDIAAYGHYSNPELYIEYRQRLEKLAENPGVQFRMIVYGEKLNEESRRGQFRIEDFPPSKKEAAEHYKRFCDSLPQKERPTTYVDFIKLLARREVQYENFLQSLCTCRAEIRKSEEPFRLFLWLADQREAVFSFEMYGEHFHEICFRTRDRDLTRTFAELFEHAWERADAFRAPLLNTLE